MMNFKLLSVLIVALVGVTGAVMVLSSDSSDADSALVHNQQWESGVNVGYTELYGWNKTYMEFSGSVPGLDIRVEYQSGGILGSADKRRVVCDGVPTTAGTYNIEVHAWTNTGYDNRSTVTILIYDVTKYYDITYNAMGGTVKGLSSWTETIAEKTYASLPAATYSGGSKTFMGWSTSSTSYSTVSSYVANGNATLYAVWSQNSVSLSGNTTITAIQGQPMSATYSTSPSSATLRISNYGGLSELSVSGKTLSGTITADPGTYKITLSASLSGWSTRTLVVTINVPVAIVPPIEYTQEVDTLFSYKPVTNPSNATISVTGVTFNGSAMTGHGFAVTDGTIMGTPKNVGTYAATFQASAPGYVSYSKTVLIYATAPNPTSPPPAIGGIDAVERADEPRTFDFIATGLANAVNIQWFVDNTEIASSSNTAVYEFATAGIYTVKAVVTGSGGATAEASVQVVNDQIYYRDMAWVGIPYNYIASYSGDGGSDISVPPGASGEIVTVNNKQYVSVSWVPTASQVGNSFTVSVPGDSWMVKVYDAQTEAPVSDFEYEIEDVDDGSYVLRVTFTGSNASVVKWDFGSGWVQETSVTFPAGGFYNVRCLAINNISERISTQMVEIEVPVEVTLDFSSLQDMYVIVDKAFSIAITGLLETDTITISGTAEPYLKVTDHIIEGKITEVGTYGLAVNVKHSDESTESKSILIYVQEEDDPEPDPVPDPIPPFARSLWWMVGFFVALAVCIVLFLYNLSHRRA